MKLFSVISFFIYVCTCGIFLWGIYPPIIRRYNTSEHTCHLVTFCNQTHIQPVGFSHFYFFLPHNHSLSSPFSCWVNSKVWISLESPEIDISETNLILFIMGCCLSLLSLAYLLDKWCTHKVCPQSRDREEGLIV